MFTLLSVGVMLGSLMMMSSSRSLEYYEVNSSAHQRVKKYYGEELSALKNSLLQLKSLAENADQNRLQEVFVESRLHYKHIEFIVEYFFRETALKVNGPNLLEATPSMPNMPLYPSGFQVVEEFVYSQEELNREALMDEVDGLLEGIEKLTQLESAVLLDDANLIYALKLNMYRLITKGITGFDSPVSLNSVKEAEFTLEAMDEVLGYLEHVNDLSILTKQSIVYLQNYSGSFDDFNRADFIRVYLNPLTAAIQEYTKREKIGYPNHLDFAIRKDAKHMFEENAFDLSFFAPQDALELTPENVALGKRLFEEKKLSVDGSRNCASCHNPQLAFTDGLKVNTVLGKNEGLLRNTPTLVNAGYQSTQFYDGRVAFLEDQAHAVITNKQEMGGVFTDIIKSLLKDKSYQKAFQEVYGEKSITDREIKLALAAFTRSLSAMNSPFDQYMRGDDEALATGEINGFNLFMGKAKCATCHFAPLFNGVAPPFYEKMESEVLGLPVANVEEGAVLDGDLGKYEIYKIQHHKRAFKTTTVRNVALTAPYMHNGVFNTLEEVVDFYNEGGGKKYGFELENQTLPFDQLNLTDEEQKHIVLFMQALTDTTYLQ
ncbi:cytochrome c peroxidase [Lishizhenia tianjinensis]|uniref:Cytochrome c peroxidase n=2 Tax=Lishizhenia tianjinensis TaxID=477690 RepID=A0A1I7A3Y3_9FLAO|nr:cytochrome c peroxidase [Lishizhenia tianjinensis]